MEAWSSSINIFESYYLELFVTMSSGLSGGTDSSLDEDDLAEIRERFKELTKEKEMLRDSKSESFDLIRRLEFHVKTLSKSRQEDKRRITDLERELSNCSQEIDYLQDQLNMSNSALSYSESRVEKLEESISSMTLEYQWEIESTKLESISLEQILLETKKLLEEKMQENSKLNECIQDLELRNLDSNKVIESLAKENKYLRENLQSSDLNNGAFVRKNGQSHESLLENHDQPFSKLEKDMSTVLDPLFSEHSIASASAADLQRKMADMSRQIDDYEALVRQLKEELRGEKLKAKDEADDLAQEMAELRYQLTLMLEDERKRRASVEQLSLHRIAELEAQIAKDRQKSISCQDLVQPALPSELLRYGVTESSLCKFRRYEIS
ncbi:Unknown protein [Striga hermonthica]|uniref:Uncharacterized protein n=1 Tax=Striga hermonthica TaxID=68872 RepID=A0A9N7RBA1_STRHE|nr:Unknown protein [Striga hermonthica]